jgi:ribonuclease J
MSASVIPGNEKQMDDMLNNLVVKDINLITSDDMDIHASGHGYAEDHKLMLALLRPEFFLPYYLTAKFRYAYKQLAIDMGMAEERCMMPNQNGEIIEMYDDIVRLADKKLNLNTVLIDGK